MSGQPQKQTLTRDAVIDLLRGELLKLTDDDSSVCKVAAERGLFCQGFHRLSDGGLRRRYSWLDRHAPGASREELEALANSWQLARQEVTQMPLACDVQQYERDSCGGWDDFSNDELSRFYFELTGRTAVIA
jgi:hypothetical protein